MESDKQLKKDIYRKDIIKVLKDVGFSEISGEQDRIGYCIPFNTNMDLEVYLKKGYLKIHLTPAFINLEIYKADSFTYIHRGRGEVIPSSWYMVKHMKLRKDSKSCMSEFRDYLLLSICRDSFLDSEEEAYQIRMDERHKGFYINEDWHDWYL